MITKKKSQKKKQPKGKKVSDNKCYYYLKLKENFFDRPEIKVIEKMESGYEYICVMQKMYLKSLSRGGKLMLTDTVPYEIETLSAALDHKQETILAAIQVFQKLDLLDILDDKSIYMTEIQNFIGKSTTEADRIREYRNSISEHKNHIPYKCTTNVQNPKTKKIAAPADETELYFVNEEIKTAWEKWREFKKTQFKFEYKHKKSEQIALDELVNLCNGNYNMAGEIVNQSIRKGWKGLFELKGNNNGRSGGASVYERADRAADEYMKNKETIDTEGSSDNG